MTRIAIDAAFEPIEIDLWGSEFETRSMPRSRSKKARVLQAEIAKIMVSEEDDESEDDKLIDLYGQLFDLKFASTNGTRTKPSTILKRKWEADDLTGEEIASFLAKITMAERKQVTDDLQAFMPEDRPT